MGNSKKKINYVYERKQQEKNDVKNLNSHRVKLCVKLIEIKHFEPRETDVISYASQILSLAKNELNSFFIFSVCVDVDAFIMCVLHDTASNSKMGKHSNQTSKCCVCARQNTVCQNETSFMSIDQKAGSIGWHFS